MAVSLYSQGAIFAQSILIAESVSFGIDADTNDQVVVTQAKGFAGITVGATEVKVSIESAIPKSGYEVDWWKWMNDRTVIEITGWRGATQIHLTGFIKSIGEKHAVNTTGKADITLQCGAPD